MSAQSVRGSEEDKLTSGSEAQDGGAPRSDSQRHTSDSEGEVKIKVDTEDSEKRRTPSTGPRESGSPDRQSRASSTERKSPSSRPRSGDSRPKSSSSGEVTFGGKGKRRKKKELLGEGHEVTFTVTISVAIPTVEEDQPTLGDDDQPDIRDLLKKKKRVFEAPRAQNYYHLEYYLVPEADELMKTDVVTYGMAAKIYMERHDPRVLKTWQDGDITWVAWSHSHTMTITKELLLKLYTHTLELRIWDTKDKVGTRAKFDRPKLFKLPTVRQGEEADEIGGVKNLVLRQSRAFIAMQPKKASVVRPLPKEITFHKEASSASKKRDTPYLDGKPGSRASGDKSSQAHRTTSPTPHTLVSVPNRDDDQDARSSFSRLGRLAGREETPGSGRGYDSRTSKVSSRRSHAQSLASRAQTEQESSKYRSSVKSAGSSGSSKALHRDPQSRRKNRRAELQAQTAAESMKKLGICSVPIRMAVLFSGLQKVTNRLENPIPGVEDMFITLQLNAPLLDEQQKQELNPMIIKLHSVTNLPDTPIPQAELKDRCLPSFCKYSFFTLPSHSTLKRDHNKDIYFDDINVVLAGTFDQSEFRQYLNGPALEIEVHDRDRKPEDVKLKATLFGDDYEDEKISNVGTVASRRTLHNPFKDRAKIWDPYGTAKVDLSDLLLGHRFLYLKVPIHNCAQPDLLGIGDNRNAGKVVGIAGAVDGPVESPIQAGHYMTNNTTLKVKVELAHPLITPDRVAAKEHIPSTNECPFGRIVFKFDYKNTSLLNQLQSLISKINARALELDDMPQHVIDAALSTYKLSATQQESRTLDIVTGFQVLDSTMHLFVLEGLRDSAVNEVWQTLPQPENSDVAVLYNSNLSFSSRLYGPLDVDLCRIKLHEPLSQIVKQPLLYVRDMVPKPCFEALVRIYDLTKTSQVRNAIRNELFPTADMVVSMSKEFGVPFTTEDFEELHVREDKSFGAEATTVTHEQSFVQESGHYWEPIDNINMPYMEKMVNRQSTGITRDFLQENREGLHAASEIIKREKTMNKPLTVKADVDRAHNYSSQALNSTELAKEKLRQILTQEPDMRFTYCQDYLHSMTVVPVNVDALKKAETAESEAQWKTEQGWIYPGMQTTLDANVHPKKPDTARVDALKEKWHENMLHVGLLQPPLDRDRLPWELRQQDVELYRQPEPNFGAPEPGTIHLAGEKLRQEKLAALSQDFENWKSKIIVRDTRQYFHRCLTETELRMSTRKASNQLAKLQGLLKDSPSKHALKKRGMSLQNIPPLNVVLNPSVDMDARLAGESTRPAVEGEGTETTKGFKPGPYMDHAWILERNKIPAIDYEHDTFMKSKGHDFNVYHKNRPVMWKRQIQPLTEEDRDNHLFRLPDDIQRYRILPELSHSLAYRSLTQPAISSVGANASDTEPLMSLLTVPTSFYDPTLNLTSEPTGLTSYDTGLTEQAAKQTSLPMAS